MAQIQWWGEHEGVGFPHVVYSQQFSRENLEQFLLLTANMEKTIIERRKVDWLHGKIVTIIFFQPSTRTYFSFWASALRLGADVMGTEAGAVFSSAIKGEANRDTARVLSGNTKSDLIVIRHPEIGSAKEFAIFSLAPIFNGGDGPGQHPTQALLDIYTIYKEYGKIDGLTIALVGDLANGRTVRSLSYLLSKFDNVKIYFTSPDSLKMKDDIKAHLDETKTIWVEEPDLKAVAKKVDVIYQTRIQKEWFPSASEYEKVRGIYIVNREIINLMPEHAIVMHPLPRVDEIRYHVDRSKKARYFEQADYGDFVRMALLLCALNPQKAEELLNQVK